MVVTQAERSHCGGESYLGSVFPKGNKPSLEKLCGISFQCQRGQQHRVVFSSHPGLEMDIETKGGEPVNSVGNHLKRLGFILISVCL